MKCPPFKGRRRTKVQSAWAMRSIRDVVRGRAPKIHYAMYAFSCARKVRRKMPDRHPWRHPWRIWKWHGPQGQLAHGRNIAAPGRRL